MMMMIRALKIISLICDLSNKSCRLSIGLSVEISSLLSNLEFRRFRQSKLQQKHQSELFIIGQVLTRLSSEMSDCP